MQSPSQGFFPLIADFIDRLAANGVQPNFSKINDNLAAYRWPICRSLMYLGLVLARTDKNSGRGSRPNEGWSKVKSRIDAFARKLALILSERNLATNWCNASEWRNLSNFCRGHTRRTTQENFYILHGLFIIHELRFSSDSANLKALIEPYLPLSEHDLPEELLRAFAAGFSSLSTVTIDEAREGLDELLMDYSTVQAYIGRNLASVKTQDFIRWFDSVKDNDHRARFICLRGSARKPSELIASFLSVLSPEGRGSNKKGAYTFRHFYSYPAKTDDLIRQTAGMVVPLDGGIYFLGGQQSPSEVGDNTEPEVKPPFRSLEMISVPWDHLRKDEVGMPGMMMSANATDRQIVSRCVLIPTKIQRYQDLTTDNLKIGPIRLADISNFVDEIIPGAALHRPTRRSRILDQIALGTNNSPEEWHLDGPYTATKDPQAKGHFLERLTHPHDVEAILSQAFGPLGYQRDDKRTFDFWSSIRFGALGVHRPG